MKVVISVIIPTYNRVEALKKCIESILKNSFKLPFEVIIIDDGSRDNTFLEIKKYIEDRKLKNFVLLKQENCGSAKARNLGIKKAKGKILLIIGDDSIADKRLLEEHYNWHKKRYCKDNFAILGHNQWSKEIEITPFMKWIDKVGLQFSYYSFVDENTPSWSHFWTCNISVKKNFLMKYGLFDEEFPCAAWEDIELGWRLYKHGLKIKYNKDAAVFHYHPTSFESVKNRMIKHGYSQKILAEKMGSDYNNPLFHQPIKLFLDIFDLLFTYTGFLYIFNKLAVFFENKIAVPLIFYPVLFHYKLKGNRNYKKRVI